MYIIIEFSLFKFPIINKSIRDKCGETYVRSFRYQNLRCRNLLSGLSRNTTLHLIKYFGNKRLGVRKSELWLNILEYELVLLIIKNKIMIQTGRGTQTGTHLHTPTRYTNQIVYWQNARKYWNYAYGQSSSYIPSTLLPSRAV